MQKGIRVNHTDVAWHSPEVMLEDVKGQMAERFWLKLFTPNVDGFWFSISCLSPAQIVPNPVSSVLCMGVREIHKEQVVAYPV